MIRRLIVEPLMDAAQSAAWVTDEESAVVAAYGSERRRRESLAWRAIVRRELGHDVRFGPNLRIVYDEVGAPVVAGGGVHISVAHCKDRVAVCISDAPCAVDIEPEDRDFSRVVPRYLSPDEQDLSCDPLWPAVAWCAKEALYKFSGRNGLDLLGDLQIDAVDLAAGVVTGRIGREKPIRLSIRREDGYIIVYVL